MPCNKPCTFVQENKTKIERCEKFLFIGNGEKPITARLTGHDKDITKVEEDVETLFRRQREAPTKIQNNVTMVIAIIMLIITLYKVVQNEKASEQTQFNNRTSGNRSSRTNDQLH